jgi:hypothetical protein
VSSVVDVGALEVDDGAGGRFVSLVCGGGGA